MSVAKLADGTILKPYLPPDAHDIGSEEWRYEMRWRKVYKNYYLVTVYRGAATVCFDELVTEEEGQDISPFLGESSVKDDLKKVHVDWLGDTIRIMSRYVRKENGVLKPHFLELIKVRKKDLPPDFPEGLVRWIP